MRMTAYWLARARVDDPDQYRKYADQVPGILAQYGARVLARGGRSEVLEGPAGFTRFVVIEFPSLEQAKACFDSADYQAAARFRREGGGVVEVVIVEGVPG
jgi:uncharacterized protein (DUF1330 family)